MTGPMKAFGALVAPFVLGVAVSENVLADNATLSQLEEVVIRAHPLSAEGLAQPVAVLEGDTLKRNLAASLGETLQAVAGVHSASFGQASGRPIVRGLGGARVKVMEDRIDSQDVSVASPDHATTIDPFVAQSIEVLKGPSTLLYGTGAVGGVVDVHTGRVPHAVPEVLDGGIEIRGTDNAKQRIAAVRLDAGLSNSIAVHLDGVYRDADEYDIPGFTESQRYRDAEETENHSEPQDEGHHEGADEVFGLLPGSQLETQGGAIGLTYVGDRGFFGAALSRYEALYGLPGHSHHHEEEHEGEAGDHDEHDEHGEEAPPVLDLEQTRWDIEGGIETPFAGIRSLNVRVGYVDYEHVELEEGAVATRFANESWEARLELSHHELLGLNGTVGMQLSDREYSVSGEEAYVTPTDTSSTGVFWVAERELGAVVLELGARYEYVEHSNQIYGGRRFDLGAASAGLIIPIGDAWTLSGTADLASRAPVAEELYAFGPHLATQSFEIGDVTLDKETSTNVTATIQYDSEQFSFSVGAFVNAFSDYIYRLNTGEQEDELPVYLWTQDDARFSGIEVEASWEAMRWDGGALTLNAGFDTVKGELKGVGNTKLPRIPPSRWLVGASASLGGLSVDLSWREVSNQNDVANDELPTDGFTDLRASVSYSMDLGGQRLEVFVNGRNLTDDEQRLHTSFIGQLAPQPGRTLEAGLRYVL